MFAKKVSYSENYSYNIQLQVHFSSYENTQEFLKRASVALSFVMKVLIGYFLVLNELSVLVQ